MITELNKDNLFEIEDSFLSAKEVKKELASNPFAKYLIYIENNNVIGYLYYSDIYDRVEINQIEIEISNRNSGKGTMLLKRLIDTVEKDITLEVKIDNFPAIKLYKKFNFEEKAIRKGYYNGIDGILMERKNTANNKKNKDSLQ